MRKEKLVFHNKFYNPYYRISIITIIWIIIAKGLKKSSCNYILLAKIKNNHILLLNFKYKMYLHTRGASKHISQSIRTQLICKLNRLDNNIRKEDE